ncbi:MAG TPA: cytidine deaminase [Candidatus Eisenbacteria bacterium]|nr:cytidine deaminase [Candidatus Eisenbacteria bacterium]
MKSDAGRLMAEADRARRRAHAPYSGFAVGAALLAEDGRVFVGVNVENASYGLTVCAERVALWKAVSEGARTFTALAVAGPPRRSASPCGACRQTLAEFAPELRVIWRDAAGRRTSRSLGQLLPHAFRLPKSRAR